MSRFIKFGIEFFKLLKRYAILLLWIAIKYQFILQSRKILSNAALSLAQQSLIYDNRTERKNIWKKIPKYFWFQPLVFLDPFQSMSKHQTQAIRITFTSYFLLYLKYTNILNLTKHFEIMVTATLRKNLRLSVLKHNEDSCLQEDQQP